VSDGRPRRHVVGRVDDLPPGERTVVDVDGRSVGVFNLGGEFFAIRNTCPHAGGPLCDGVLSGMVVSDQPGEYTYLRRGEFIRCPWHQWEFDVRTGRSWFDPARTRVRRYDVTVRSGNDLGPDTDPGPDADLVDGGLERGPHTAETYPARRDGDWIVIELG
jgi:3-phenylpropionate/trans-cinnamate dioxygenase ferredoxin subunit